MSDDSLEGMPDFAKPESIPLVVPDEHPKHLCIATTKAGGRCGFVKSRGTDYCVPHDPAITHEQRQEWRKKRTGAHPRPSTALKPKTKSKTDLLAILSTRFDKFLERFGDMVNPEIEQTICDMARTYIAVLKTESAEGDAKTHGWRMKGTA